MTVERGIQNTKIEMDNGVAEIIAIATNSLKKDLGITTTQAEKIILEQAITNYARVWAEQNDPYLIERYLKQ